MFGDVTDDEWERWGAADPYFGVLTHAKFRRANLTDANMADFFQSGEEHLAHVLRIVRSHIDPAFAPRRAVDFGCGVGRVLIPLAQIAEHVTGIDVSESMLSEAETNCRSRSISNVEFVKSDDELSLLRGTYDFIHSFLVFQHIPIRRGERILQNLLDHLHDGSVCVVHFTYGRQSASGSVAVLKAAMRWMRNHVPFARKTISLVRRGLGGDPGMQMNAYDLNSVLLIAQRNGVLRCHLEFTDHDGELGVLMFFQKRNLA